MAIGASRRIHQEFSALYPVGEIRTRHGVQDWLGSAENQMIHGKYDLCFRKGIVYRWKRTQVHDDRSQVFIRQFSKVLVRHERKQTPAIMTDSLTDRSGERVIAPRSG